VGINITVLGSGSAGNCTLVESESTRILVDAGLSGRQTEQRLCRRQLSLESITGILLTHEHTDHTRGLTAICKKHAIPVYANRLTAEAVQEMPELAGKQRVSWRLFSTGHTFTIGDIAVESFSVPHDAFDPVGFMLRTGEHGIGILTDLGHATRLVAERIRGATVLVLEANHDLKMLQDDTIRPWATKQRIMSRHGHLSNDAAATLAGEVATDRLRHVFLAHLSRDCNRPELAHRVVAEKLQGAGAGRAGLVVASQDTPTVTVTL
jgi:phosphoribosyl 1,2-cyclic phosphodiesterase